MAGEDNVHAVRLEEGLKKAPERNVRAMLLRTAGCEFGNGRTVQAAVLESDDPRPVSPSSAVRSQRRTEPTRGGQPLIHRQVPEANRTHKW
jgi:hypothetical protein